MDHIFPWSSIRYTTFGALVHLKKKISCPLDSPFFPSLLSRERGVLGQALQLPRKESGNHGREKEIE